MNRNMEERVKVVQLKVKIDKEYCKSHTWWKPNREYEVTETQITDSDGLRCPLLALRGAGAIITEIPEPAPEPAEETSIFTDDSATRKQYPVFSGLLEYFPRACAEICHLSYLANRKHNGDEPLHWAEEKSSDHKDCELRHAMDHDYVAKAWRALADLETEMKKGYDPEREYKQYHEISKADKESGDLGGSSPSHEKVPTGYSSKTGGPHLKGIHH